MQSIYSKKQQHSSNPITQVSKEDPTNHQALMSTQSSTSKFLNYICRCLLPIKQQPQAENLTTQPVQKVQQLTQNSQNLNQKILVLDLDETLVHSSFQPVQNADFVLNIKVQGNAYTVYVSKRPGCEQFLDEMAKYFQVVIFTASLQEYADPLMDLIDLNRVAQLRLFREHCSIYKGAFIKDMNIFNQNLKNIILVDNSETSFLFQPENAVHIKAYFDDPKDRLMPVLAYLSKINDVRRVDSNWKAFEDAEDTIKIGPSSPSSKKSSKRQRNKFFDKLAFLNKLNEKYGEHYNFLQKFQNLCSSEQVIGSYDELDQPLTNRQDKNCNQYYQQDPALDDKEIELQNKDDQKSFQIRKQVEKPVKKSPKKTFKKPCLEIDIEAVNEQTQKQQETPVDSFREKSQRSTRNLLGKSKEYEDQFVSNIDNQKIIQKNIQDNLVSIQKEQKKIFDEIRFQGTAANMNSPVAKQQFIDFFDKNKRILSKSQDI